MGHDSLLGSGCRAFWTAVQDNYTSLAERAAEGAAVHIAGRAMVGNISTVSLPIHTQGPHCRSSIRSAGGLRNDIRWVIILAKGLGVYRGVLASLADKSLLQADGKGGYALHA
jgi:hypothetical protein